MPQVSVIIPAFNASSFIEGTLASATAQSLTDIEIIVIDDCSTDDTRDLVSAAARKDKRIRLIAQERNGGPSVARNIGIDAALGHWIALLDADDAYAPDRLEKMVTVAERHNADLLTDNLLLMPEENPAATRPMIPPSILNAERPLDMREFVRRNIEDPEHPDTNYGFLKPIMRRAFLNEHAIRYDASVRFAEDFALYAQCLRLGAKWWMMPEPLYHYLVRTDSLTHVQTVHDLGKLRALQARLLTEATQDGDADLAGLIRRHMTVVDRCYHYRAFTDDLKARQFSPAIRRLLGDPRAAGLIVQESLRQMPVIAAKVLRGGYGRD